MKIGIQTWGSRGDINPWIALGQGLAKNGHEVTLYYTNYSNVDFSNYSTNNLRVKSTKEFYLNSGVYEKVPCKKLYNLNPLELTDYMVKEIFDLFEDEIVLAAEYLCKNADLIINNPNLYQTAAIAEKYAVPRINILVESQYTPKNTVSDFTEDNINAYFLERINNFRKKYQLKAITNVRAEAYTSEILNLLAYSKVFDAETIIEDDKYQSIGYLDLKNEISEHIPEDLEIFLSSGEKPVFFSMGSLTFFEGDNYEILDIFLDAISLSNCRAIIQANWKKVNRILPKKDNIFYIDYIPHELVLPNCAAIVHHGGAGTSHAAILNGCPSIVIAYAWDQFYWGKELQKLGSAAGFLKRKYLDEIQLAGSISKVIKDEEYKIKTDELRRKVKREKGVNKGVKLIEQFITQFETVN